VLVAIVVALAFLGMGNKSKPPAPAGLRAGAAKHHRRRAHRTTPPAATPKTVKLQLAPTGTVYVCLVDGAGKKLIPGQIFGAGQTIPTETAPTLLLTLGNASVHMKVNGSPVNVPASSSSIGFMLRPSGTTSLAASKQPRCT
jgi:cytoskeleton protein RodZ